MILQRILKHRFLGRLPTLTVVAIILSALYLSTAQTMPKVSSGVAADKTVTLLPKQVAEGKVEAVVLVSPSDRYELFGDVEHSITISIAARGRNQSSSNIFVIFFPPSFYPESITAPGSNYTIGYERLYGEIKFFLPQNASLSIIEVEGVFSSTSVLWRNSALFAQIQIASYFGPTTVQFLVSQPPNSRILDIYVGVPYHKILIEAKSYIAVQQYTPTFSVEDVYKYYDAAILYEPTERSATSGIAMISVFAIVGSTPYLLNSGSYSSIKKLFLSLRRIYRRILRQISSSRLLSAYILCVFLMISLGLYAGHDPRVKVFVLASPQTSDQIIKTVKDTGGIALTIKDTATEIETISSLGALSAFIVADFTPTDDAYSRNFLYPAMENVRTVIVLPSLTNRFQTEVRERFPKAIVEAELSDLSTALAKLKVKPNFFGINIDVDTFLSVAKAEALLSFVLVFLGLAYLANRLIEVGSQPMFSGIAEAVIYVVAYYVVTQAVLMSSSFLLGMPLGLHAVTSGSLNVTALGLLGLGGGSRPRMLVAFFGILLGSIMATKGGFRLDRLSLFALIMLFVFIALDPLTNGVLFHQFILLFTVGPEFESSATIALLIKNFLGYTADMFGGWVTPSFAISRGILLYYMGAIPLVLIPKLRQTSATLLLFIATFAISLGGIRVAEMTPWKTLTNIFPGVAGGLVITMLFTVISVFENAVRNMLGKHQE